MESHPVPQNITSFEFHLVGDMTLKQFGYLATGLSIAYLTFMFLFPTSPIIAIPIITISTLSGVIFAFLPIQDRPLDYWLAAFIKAVFSPTKASWKPFGLKDTIKLDDPIFTNRLQLYLIQTAQITTPISNAPTTTSAVPKNPPHVLPATPPSPALQPKPTQPSKPPTTTQPTQAQNLPSDEQLRSTVELAKQAQTIQVNIIDTEKRINQLRSAVNSSRIDSQVYLQQMHQTAQMLQSLIDRAEQLKANISQAKPLHKVVVEVKKPQVKIIEPPKQTSKQLLLTSLPNVINGIVTDNVGSYLEAVVVVIHNQDGLPVRASKTNKLGQFTGATPLPSGIYTITLEKEKLEFDVLQIELKGEVLAPLQIQAKKSI